MRVVFITPEAESIELDVAEGVTLMRAAVDHNVSGMVGDCGGCLSCATCHVYVDEGFVPLLPPLSDNEDQMLEFLAAERRGNSRLSCQIPMSAALDGIIAHIADPQI
ncbi:MAG: 2Fe-2S iron-sulfur cluster-binding protein [Janthinobacterium lividum]